MLLSDATMLHKKMIKANVPARLDVYKGMWHVFQMSPFKTAYEAMDKCAAVSYTHLDVYKRQLIRLSLCIFFCV